jgi:hypothetical protein
MRPFCAASASLCNSHNRTRRYGQTSSMVSFPPTRCSSGYVRFPPISVMTENNPNLSGSLRPIADIRAKVC